MQKPKNPDNTAKVQMSIWLSKEQYLQLAALTSELKASVARGTSQSDLVSFALAELFKTKNRRNLEAHLKHKYSATSW